VKFGGPALHAVGRPVAAGGRDGQRQVEDDGQIGLQATGREPAGLPELGHVEATGVALVDDVGQHKAVRHDGPTGVEGGPDHLGDQLGPAGHEQQRLARQGQLAAAV